MKTIKKISELNSNIDFIQGRFYEIEKLTTFLQKNMRKYKIKIEISKLLDFIETETFKISNELEKLKKNK